MGIHTATRLTHLISMLNDDDATVKELARASLLLDLRKRKVPLAKPGQLHSGKLDTKWTQAAGFGVRSDWPDLHDLCNRMTVKLEWTQHNSHTAPQASDAVVTDPSLTAETTVYHNEAQHTLQNTTARRFLLNIKQTDTKQHWTGLRECRESWHAYTLPTTLSHTPCL